MTRAPLDSPLPASLAALALLLAPGPTRAQQPRGASLHDHRIQSASSADGLAWTRDPGVRIMGGSVPCAINDGDRRVLLYYVKPPSRPGFPETVACASSSDGTNFRLQDGFRIEGLSALKAVDPSIVRDPAGKFRLYYLASDHRGDPASAPGPHAIRMATSDDGIRFSEQGTVLELPDLVDPDVFHYRGRWFLYAFARRATIIATSENGQRFQYAGDLDPPDWGTTAPIQLPDGRLRLYAFAQRVPAGNPVRSFLSTDGIRWTAESGDRLVASENEQITDPFVIPWRGGYRMFFKSSPARAPGGFSPPGTPGTPGPQMPQNLAPTHRTPGQMPDGPWNRDVLVYRVARGAPPTRAAIFERAGVPTIARLNDGRIIAAHQHFPENDPANFDKVAVRFSSDDGATWTGPQVILLAGLPDGMRFPFDPTLVPLPDGRVRIYFTSNRGRQIDQGKPAIYSALSDDAVHYTFEPGARFEIDDRPVIDCAVALHRGVFHLFAPDNGTRLPGPPTPGAPPDPARPDNGYHATSADGLTFTRAPDVAIGEGRRWLGNAFSDGERLLFIGTADPRAQGRRQHRGSTWMATSQDGQSWTPIAAPEIGGGDPGAIPTRDGGLLVVITGESRQNRAGR